MTDVICSSASISSQIRPMRPPDRLRPLGTTDPNAAGHSYGHGTQRLYGRSVPLQPLPERIRALSSATEGRWTRRATCPSFARDRRTHSP